MSDELRTLLHDAAPAPTREVDPDRVHARRRRRDHVRTGAVVAATAAVIAVGVALLTPPTPDAPIALAKPLSWPDGPSQSDSDAAEQDVPPEVAALPTADRLEIRGAVHVDGTLYVTSGLPFGTADTLAQAETRLSDGTAPYEYEEILAIDVDSLRIEQAWPTAGLSLEGDPFYLPSSQTLVAMRAGDGGEPWTSLMTVDLDPGLQRAWVELPPDVEADKIGAAWQERDWVGANTTDLPLMLLGEVDGQLAAADHDGIHLYDPATLQLVRSLTVTGNMADVRPVGDGVVLDPGDKRSDFHELTPDGVVATDRFPSVPSRAVDAVTAAPGLATIYSDGTPALWVHHIGGWRPVDEATYHAADDEVELHAVDGRAVATSGATLYLAEEDGVRTHAVAPSPGPEGRGRGTDIVAPGHPDGWLWIHGDLPFAVTDPARAIDNADEVEDATQAHQTPSQPRDEAARDGVDAEIAALPFDARVDLVDRLHLEPVETPEGVWALSRMPPMPDCPLSDVGPAAEYPCGPEYGEVLLLDHDRTRILRAFPMPEVVPQHLLVTDDAVYCTHQADGGLPLSAVCRVDRDTYASTVRVFPRSEAGGYIPVQADLSGWDIGPTVDSVVFTQVAADGGTLTVSGPDGELRLAADTLELLGDEGASG